MRRSCPGAPKEERADKLWGKDPRASNVLSFHCYFLEDEDEEEDSLMNPSHSFLIYVLVYFQYLHSETINNLWWFLLTGHISYPSFYNTLALPGNLFQENMEAPPQSQTPENDFLNNYDSNNKYLVKSGSLGMCHDAYCLTCPIYLQATLQRNSNPSDMFNDKVHHLSFFLNFLLKLPTLHFVCHGS